MTVYFDHNVQFPGSAATLSGITHDLMCWHKSFPILAVSSKNEKNNTDGSVHFFLDEVRGVAIRIHSDVAYIAVGNKRFLMKFEMT